MFQLITEYQISASPEANDDGQTEQQDEDQQSNLQVILNTSCSFEIIQVIRQAKPFVGCVRLLY